MNLYDASAIQVLAGLDAVRRRPAMYIGSTGALGVRNMVLEVLQNSVDEALAGHCTEIFLGMQQDGSIEITDNGRGIPVDVHRQSGRSACELVLTTLHAGGKFNQGAYSSPGGLNGVGLSCVNALSAWMQVDVWRDGQHHQMACARGALTSPLRVIEESSRHGTRIHFLPDSEIFGRDAAGSPDLAMGLLLHAEQMAFLNPGLRLLFKDEKSGAAGDFRYESGLAGFVAHRNAARALVHHEPVFIHGSDSNVEVAVALQWTQGYGEDIHSFVNSIPTPQGGVHVEGLWAAMTQVINRLAEGWDTDSRQGISGLDIREGLTAVLSLRLPDPEFDGSTKTSLTSPVARVAVERIVEAGLSRYLKEHPEVAAAVVGRTLEATRARWATRRAIERARHMRKSYHIDHDVYRQQFGERSKNWHESAVWITHQGLLQTHASSCQVSSDAVVLDTCCGSGVVGASFKDRVAKVIGLDLTPQMVELAKQRLDDVVLGDVYEIPFPQGMFDLVCNREVLHLLPQPLRPVSEMFRVLKPGGQIIVGQWVPYGALDAAWMYRIVKKKQPLFVNNLLEQDLHNLLRTAGFVNVTCTEYRQWEDIDNWIDSWETTSIHRHEIRDLYRNAPAEVRAVHPFEIDSGGKIRDLWRWCVFSAFKPA